MKAHKWISHAKHVWTCTICGCHSRGIDRPTSNNLIDPDNGEDYYLECKDSTKLWEFGRFLQLLCKGGTDEELRELNGYWDRLDDEGRGFLNALSKYADKLRERESS